MGDRLDMLEAFFDRDLDGADDGYWPSNPRPRQGDITRCLYCKEGPFKWEPFSAKGLGLERLADNDNGWRLVDSRGNIHNCTQKPAVLNAADEFEDLGDDEDDSELQF